MLRAWRRGVLPIAVRLNAAAVLALLLCGCASSSNGPVVIPEPLPPLPRPAEPETFAGKAALKSRIEAAGGFAGMVAIFDAEDSDHGRGMRQELIDQGVPADNIAFPYRTAIADVRDMEHERNADLLARARVAHLPVLAPLRKDDEPPVIARNNIVWSIAAGNTHSPSVDGDRDFWRPDHAFWVRSRDTNCCTNAWENHMLAFDTGKALIATYAFRDGEGGFTHEEGIVSCGEARDACIAVAAPQDFPGGTSDASAKLAAAAFYVFQLYEQAEEVVETLSECAVDIGEPGVDYEFGLGVLSLACDRVEDAEVLTASSSLVLRWDAPALEALLGARRSAGLSVRASRWIADYEGLPLARLGAAYGIGHLELSLSAGRGHAPLGVGSRFVHARPAPYAAAGAGWRLWDSDGRDLRAMYSFGRGGGALSPRTTRAGLAWRASMPRGSWAVYAGRSRVEAWIGIPGHRAADRGRSPARSSGWGGLLTFERRH